MRANTTPRISGDPDLTRELREHATLINAMTDGRLVGTNNAYTAAPTTGTWARGDFVRNTQPADSGTSGNKYTLHGWICVAGGTPGTWLQARYMTDDVSGGGGVIDGDKGDITVSSSGTVWTIDNGVVTAAKTSITGTPNGTKYLRDDFSWQASPGVSDGDKGDITVSSSGTVWTIDNDVVTYAKMQNVSATSRVLGRKTSGAGDAEELTLSETLDFVGSAAQGDILYRGSSTWARLGAGNAGQVLTTGGASANPSWSAVTLPVWNKIINGAMKFSQRATSFSFPTLATATPTLDKWVCTYSMVGGTWTVSQDQTVVPSSEFLYSLKVKCDSTRTIGANDYVSINNPIEGFNISDLFDTTFTLSFWVRSSATGTFTVRWSNINPDSASGRVYLSEYVINSADTWEFKTVVVTGGLTTSGTWDRTTGLGLSCSFVLACGSTYQTTGGVPNAANTWITPSGSVPVISTSSQNNNFFLNTSNAFHLTGVQINIGATAAAFENVLYGPELSRVQRYCYIFRGPAPGICESTTVAHVDVEFPVPMRVAPGAPSTTGASLMTIATYTTLGTPWQTALNPSSVSLGTAELGPNGARVPVNNYANLIAGNPIMVAPFASTSGHYFIFSAEL